VAARTSRFTMRADDIPVAHTPAGGWKTMPPPILAGCTEPLCAGAPDLRGTWRAHDVTVDGEPAPADHPLRRHVERIEQCGNRVVVVAAGVVHDMRADGVPEHGVDDVAAASSARIRVTATFADGALVLRPRGMPGTEVTRRIVDGELVWRYGPSLVVRSRRT
jgi:hypothetical protein